MKGAIAVAAAELREKRFILAAALLAGLLTLGLSAIPGVDWMPDERALIGLWIAAAFSGALAMILGASHLAKDIADGRIRFYFARPITALGLWIGKVAAALLLIIVSGIVVTLPTLIAARFDLGVEAKWFAAALVLVPLLFLAHGFSLAIRSRSAWSLLLVVSLLAAGMATWACLRALHRIEILPWNQISVVTLALIVATATIALVAGGLESVRRGRGDLRESFLAFLRVLVGASLLIALIAVPESTWYLSVRPADIASFSTVVAAPDGDFLFVSGSAPSRPGILPSFITDLTGSRAEFVRWVPWLSWAPVFSADGRVAAWVDGGPGAGADVRVCRLDGLVECRIFASTSASASATVSPDGDGVAVVSYEESRPHFAIYDSTTSRLLAAFTAPPDLELLEARFVSSDLLRLLGWAFEPVYAGSIAHMRVLDFSVSQKTLRLKSTVEFPSHLMDLIRIDNSGRRALFRERGESPTAAPRGARLVDLETGLGLAQFEASTSVDFLFDGRVAQVEASPGGRSQLRLFRGDGRLEATFPIPSAQAIGIGPEIDPGRLLLTASHDRKYETLAVNLSSGELHRLGGGLVPVARALYYWMSLSSEAGRSVPKPGSPGTRLFLNAARSLVRLDPTTGKQTVLLGKSAR